MNDEFEPSADDEPCYCSHCNGSGEGMYDGSRCGICHGSGVALPDCDDDYDDSDYEF